MRNRIVPLVSLALAACAGSPEPLASDTGVVAEVGLWPIDPVEVAGQPSRTRPAVGARVVALDGSGDEIAEGTTDGDGRARLLLPPGEYTIAVEECPGAMSLPKENVDVAVQAGSFASASLTCDTGIR